MGTLSFFWGYHLRVFKMIEQQLKALTWHLVADTEGPLLLIKQWLFLMIFEHFFPSRRTELNWEYCSPRRPFSLPPALTWFLLLLVLTQKSGNRSCAYSAFIWCTIGYSLTRRGAPSRGRGTIGPDWHLLVLHRFPYLDLFLV